LTYSKARPAKNNPSGSSIPLNILGINTGTSADGLNLVLAEFDTGALPYILDSDYMPFKKSFRDKIITVAQPGFSDGLAWLEIDRKLGEIIGEIARRFVLKARRRRILVDLIASHGQTIRHLPERNISLQIGNPSVIAAAAGLPVIAEFRKSDLAAGGQGAPLSPILHEYLFRDTIKFRAVVNIGGISNITVLPSSKSGQRPFAADCGPGNMVIDNVINRLFRKPFDRGGKTALSGRFSRKVVSSIMQGKFFKLPPPKSTGHELFGSEYVDKLLLKCRGLSKADIVATASEITVRSIVDFIARHAPKVEEIILCGGGVNNKYITSGIARNLKRCDLFIASDFGFASDHIEPLLWAYLAFRFVKRIPSDTSRYTGARKSHIPGSLWLP